MRFVLQLGLQGIDECPIHIVNLYMREPPSDELLDPDAPQFMAAKKARTGAAPGEMKEDKMRSLQNAVDTDKASVRARPLCNDVGNIMDRIDQLMILIGQRPDTAASESFDNLDLKALQKVQEALASLNTHKVELRHAAINKQFWVQELEAIARMKQQLDLVEKILSNTTSMLLQSEFSGDSGAMSWERLNKVVMLSIMNKAALVGARAAGGAAPGAA